MKKILHSHIGRMGKHWGIDLHFFFRNGVLQTAGFIVQSLKGLVTGYLVARLVAPDVYGSYRFVLTILSVVALTGLEGMVTATARFIAKEGKDKVPLRHTMRLQTYVGLIGTALLLACIPLLHLWDREYLWPLFVLVAILYIPRQLAETFFGAIIVGTSNFAMSLRFSIVSSIVIMIATVVALWLQPTPFWLLASSVVVGVVIQLAFLLKSLSAFPSHEKSPRILNYGWQLSINTLPVSASWYLDGLLVSYFFGLNDLAVLSVAILLPEQVKQWAKMLLPVSFAKMAGAGQKKTDIRKLLQITGRMTLLSVLPCAIGIVLAPWFMPFLFPNYDAQVIVPLTQIGIGFLIVLPSTLNIQYLEAQGLVKPLRQAQWTATALFVVATSVLIPTLGLIGAVVARGLFRLVYSVHVSMYLFIEQSRKSAD